MKSFNDFINESNRLTTVFFHGSTDKNMSGKNGIHIGSKLAATEALEARIGVPAKGEWDGKRIYAKTKLAGQKTLRKIGRNTGFNCGGPDDDYYPEDRIERAYFSDGSQIPLDCKPIVFPVEIIGSMSNSQAYPHEDFKANGYMMRQLRKGNAKNGYYYENIAEDSGSISAVVPDKSFLKII